MKCVCKKMFVRTISLGSGNFITVDVQVGDVLEYLGTTTYGSYKFETENGLYIMLSKDEVKEYIKEVEYSRRDKISCMLERISKIESDVSELRVELEDIMREIE